MNRIAVIGAGTMGAGIAQACAMAEYSVVLYDQNPEALQKGIEVIKKQLHRLVEKGKYTDKEVRTIIENIVPSSEINSLHNIQFVIEAVPEKMEIKKSVYEQIEEVCNEDVIFATNTSGLNITEISSALKRPERLVCMHFFYPVPVMPIVEIVGGYHTSQYAIEAAVALAEKLGKKAIKVKESPLFVVNRIMIPMVNEAIFVLQEGICEKEEIDEAMKLAMSYPIGPLALADLIGLDVLLDVINTIHEETNDPKYRPAPLLRQMVRAGNLGRKTGTGFYQYT